MKASCCHIKNEMIISKNLESFSFVERFAWKQNYFSAFWIRDEDEGVWKHAKYFSSANWNPAACHQTEINMSIMSWINTWQIGSISIAETSGAYRCQCVQPTAASTTRNYFAQFIFVIRNFRRLIFHFALASRFPPSAVIYESIFQITHMCVAFECVHSEVEFRLLPRHIVSSGNRWNYLFLLRRFIFGIRSTGALCLFAHWTNTNCEWVAKRDAR